MIQKLASLRIGELNLITQYLNITCNLYGCHLFSRIDNITIFPSAGYYTGLYNFMRLAFFIIMANETSKINFHYTILQFIFFSVVVLPTWASCSKDSRITQVIMHAGHHKLFICVHEATHMNLLWRRSFQCSCNAAVLWCLQWAQTTRPCMPKCLSSLCTANFIWSMSVTQHQFKIQPLYYWANCKSPSTTIFPRIVPARQILSILD